MIAVEGPKTWEYESLCVPEGIRPPSERCRSAEGSIVLAWRNVQLANFDRVLARHPAVNRCVSPACTRLRCSR